MRVLLVSKGPSARYISKSKDYKIACLNNAIVLCEEVDFFFCHDQDNIDIIDPNEWKKVKNFIMPYYPQKAHPGGFSSDYTYERWTKFISDKITFFPLSIKPLDMARPIWPTAPMITTQLLFISY